MALTQKQELFCQAVASGMSYKDAYFQAYDTTCKDRTALTEGSRLALREDIQERIKALTKPIQEAAQIQGLNAREKQLQEIDERINICKQKDDETSLIRWYDMKAKILGLYASHEDKESPTNVLSTMDTNDLLRLVK